MDNEQPDDWVQHVERLLPAVMRLVFAPPPEGSPLWGLPLPQLRTLFTLRCRGDLTMGDVAGTLGIAVSTATQLADRLEATGLVIRRADPADRRIVRLALTEPGRVALAEHAAASRVRLHGARSHLTAADCETVLTGLRLLEAAARPSSENAPPPPLWQMLATAAAADELKS